MGWDRGQGDREKCSKRCPGMGTEEWGNPEDGVSPSPRSDTPCPGPTGIPPVSPPCSDPCTPTLPEGWLWAMSPAVSPGPSHPTHTPVPVPPFLCALDVSPCPCHPRTPVRVPTSPFPCASLCPQAHIVPKPSSGSPPQHRRTLRVGGDPRVALHPLHPTGGSAPQGPPQELTKNLVRVLQFGDRHGGTGLGTEGTVREEGAAPLCLPVSRGGGGWGPSLQSSREGVKPPPRPAVVGESWGGGRGQRREGPVPAGVLEREWCTRGGAVPGTLYREG